MSDGTFDALLRDFTLETAERLDRIQELLLAALESGISTQILKELRRELHTIKGNSAMMGLAEMRQTAHEAEDLLAGSEPSVDALEASLVRVDALRAQLPRHDDEATVAQNATGTIESIRVTFSVLDELLESIAELITATERLGEVFQSDPTVRHAEVVLQALEGNVKAVRQLRTRIVSMRMIPLRMVLGQTSRIVHDESARLLKKVAYATEGLDTTIDRAAVGVVTEAVGHLVRNAIVHGIEAPDARRRAKKPEEGNIRIGASMQSGSIRIAVIDDGGGIDFEQLRASAVSRGIDVAAVSDRDLVFLPNVSTWKETDLGAGRGVGMAAVQSAVQQIGGRIDLATERGQGSAFVLSFPVSVSMFRVLLVEADSEVYAVPLLGVLDALKFERADAHDVNRSLVLPWRKRVVPAMDLGYAFGTAVGPRANGMAIVVGSDRNCRAVIVDRVLGIGEAASRPIDPIVKIPPGVSSSMILTDGRVALVLDPVGLTTMPVFHDVN
jgi:two-component system chemotaxis sensor kinase CheA